MKKQTQIEAVRERMKENTMYLNVFINRTDLEAYTFLFECGCHFLESVYGIGTADYKLHSRSKKYWSWFRLQWYGVEESFLQLQKRHARRTPPSIVKHQYTQYMTFYCCNSQRMEQAFNNYLKQTR